jgi:hypothetical protein
VSYSAHDIGDRFAAERVSAGERFVEHQTKTPEIERRLGC